MAHVGARPVAVVGQRLDQQRDATRSIALVYDGFDPIGIDALAGALADRPLDIVLRHRGVARLLDGQRQRRVAIWVSPALTGGDRDRASQLGEVLAAAGGRDSLLVLDRVPLGMSGHTVDQSSVVACG